MYSLLHLKIVDFILLPATEQKFSHTECNNNTTFAITNTARTTTDAMAHFNNDLGSEEGDTKYCMGFVVCCISSVVAAVLVLPID